MTQVFMGNSIVSAVRANMDLIPEHYYSPFDDGLVVGPSAGSQTTALQSALTRAAALGGRVWLPQGVIVVTPGILIPTNVMLMGNKTILRVIAGYAGTNPVLWLAGVADCALDDLVIDCNKAGAPTASSVAILASTVSGLTMRRIKAINGVNNGIVISSASDVAVDRIVVSGFSQDGLSVLGVTDSQFGRIFASGNRSGVVLGDSGSTGSKRVRLLGGQSNGNSQFGYNLVGRNSADIELVSASADSNTQDGLVLNNMDNVSVQGGIVSNNGQCGARLYMSRYNSFIGTKFRNNSASLNAGYSEISLSDDGVIGSIQNVFEGVHVRIQGANKAVAPFTEIGSLSGPNYVTGGFMDNGTGGGIQLANASSRATLVGSQRANNDKNEKTVAANYAVTADDEYIRVDTSAGDVTITLPGGVVSGMRQSWRIFKVAAAHNLNISAGGPLINGAATLTLTTQYAVTTVTQNGAANGYDAT